MNPAVLLPVVAVVQARMGSTRLPNKVLREVGGRPLIELLLRRLAAAKLVDRIVLATSVDPRNDRLAAHVERLGYSVYRGSEENVLDRYYRAASPYSPRAVVRITGDCPLIDPQVVDRVIRCFLDSGVDYASNTNPPTYPDGLDTEVFAFSALERAWREAVTPYQREHVTPYLRESGYFTTVNVSYPEDHSGERWTVDEPEDFIVIEAVCASFPNEDFTLVDVLRLRDEKPELFTANAHLRRNEGTAMGRGQKLWRRAKRVIPGGSMLLSKRAEMFLPNSWPAYFSRASGCRIWDLDGRELIDTSLMGIGTNILGYGHPEVDEAVQRVIRDGNLATLNCPEEVFLAERLVEIHPWAQMARFARSGGEAVAVAIRIARAFAGREQVAFCGYHGWHDWYLAANLTDGSQLTGHLLPGLEPKGVPSGLRNTAFPFRHNKLDELECIVAERDIGVIIMEVMRNFEPAPGFLDGVRRLASSRGIVLIFDECTSGFRRCLGGLHRHYRVEPDVAVFGKTLGNGYALTAVLGRREIMSAAQETFISSTFWTERIGPAAALKALEVMEAVDACPKVDAIGQKIIDGWLRLADRHGIGIEVTGLPALATFRFVSPKNLAYKTLITQEMLKRGYLASTGFYACTEHTPAVCEAYLFNLDSIFALIGECERGSDVATLLEGPICHGGFQRLN